MTVSLFERLRASADKSSPTWKFRTYDNTRDPMIASILRNLERLLNSRRGQSPACPDYGLMDMNAVIGGLPDSAKLIEREIQDCIERYEPRLRGVRVERIEDPDQPLTVLFQISATMVSDSGRQTEKFDTVVAPSRKVRVRHR